MRISSDALQAALEASLTRHQVAGASVAVFNKGELVTAAAGTINVTTGVALTPETVMHIGSITKVFTTTLVMQLVDEGSIDLGERVVRYLPELRLRDSAALERITVRMLLNHTSGIDGEITPDQGHDEETIEKRVARMAQMNQVHSPGAEYSYCNAAFVIAGYLVQRLRGESWYQLIKDKIFVPLQMEHAVTLPEEALLHRASVGHFLDPTTKKLVRTTRAFNPIGRAPCGPTLMMSARDLIAFARAHMALGVAPNGTRIVSARSAQAMQQITVSNQGKNYTSYNMGLGWMVTDNGLLTHTGGAPGVASILYAHPEQQWAAAILTNAAHGLKVSDEFMEPWLQEFGSVTPLGVDDSHLPSTPLPIDADKYVGSYENIAIRYHVLQTAEGLALSSQAKFAYYDDMSTETTPPARLISLGGEQFLLEPNAKDENSSTASHIFTFRNPDAQGRMQHMGNGGRLYRAS